MRPRALAAVASLLACALAAPSPARADEVTVFAAASLTDVLREIAAPFMASTGHHVNFNFAGSNDLARQIRAGAPADLFFSADQAQMDAVAADGRVKPADRIDVLSNSLVVVVPATSTAKVATAADLKQFKRIALANPEAVPAGIYARTYLISEGAWDLVKGKVVPTLDVRAALAAVEADVADAAIVYRTDAARSSARVALEVPREKGPRIVYPLALLTSRPVAAQLRDLFVSEAARAIYQKHGFVVILDK